MSYRTCAHCGRDITAMHFNTVYCSDSCRDAKKYLERPRVPCVNCGGPTGYATSRPPVKPPRCLACKREGPQYRIKDKRARGMIDEWTCRECGVRCVRPATRGQRPKYCEKCRRVKRNPLITLPHRVRLSIYKRDAWACRICGDPVDEALIGSKSPWRPSLDHITPRSMGGGDEVANLRLAHVWCNSVRGAGRKDDLFKEAS